MLSDELQASLLAAAEENPRRIEATAPEKAAEACELMCLGVSRRKTAELVGLDRTTANELWKRHAHCMRLGEAHKVSGLECRIEKTGSICMDMLEQLDSRGKTGAELEEVRARQDKVGLHGIAKMLTALDNARQKMPAPAPAVVASDYSLEDVRAMQEQLVREAGKEAESKVAKTKIKKKETG